MCVWETQYHLPQYRSALAEDSKIMIFEISIVPAQLPFREVTFCVHMFQIVYFCP
jgi:hypothetical protein